MFWILLCIFIFCFIMELLIAKKDNVDLFNFENFLPILFIPFSFPWAIYILFWAMSMMIDQFKYDYMYDFNLLHYYYLPFLLGSLFYIVHYIKRLLYSFLPNNTKLKLYRNKHIFYILK